MRILIALDDSPVSAHAAREATRLFGSADTQYFVINVARVPTPWVGTSGFGAVAPLPVDQGWLDESYPDLELEQQNLMARAAALGVPDADASVAVGDPVTLICAAAEEHDADVIVVGSHNKTALGRLLDPSVAAGVVRDTFRPVLVVSGTPPD